ncbi:MAG TPA: PqiC family protein [Thermodesulfobacteriota bacterium]|nr:PqiC family protein [Thermodesulfobacteriota bacterium]
MKNILRTIVLGTVSLSLAVMSGCARTQPATFYLLRPLVDVEKPQEITGQEKAPLVVVGPIIFPKYLDRPFIVTRTQGNALKLAQFDRWAEPLKDNFSRVLTENLGILLNTDRMAMFPWKSAQDATFQVTMEVLCFEGDSQGNVLLSARWIIYGDEGKKELLAKKSDLTEAVGAEGYDALVSAQNRILMRLSKEIAGAIKAFGEGEIP